jgi:hypothetical protein
MSAMSNLAYMSIWCKDFSEAKLLEQFTAFLATVPYSASKPGFTHLVIRAVDFAEIPVLEQDFRSSPIAPANVAELVVEHLHNDSAYEVRADWDLWVSEGGPARWQNLPQPLELSCHGEEFEDQIWREHGHLEAGLGFEHLFTGHAGLLGFRRSARALPQSPEEASFLASMEEPANLQMYLEKTRENIRKLFAWVRGIEEALPVDQIRLWSEGEENFEARLEEILAAH